MTLKNLIDATLSTYSLRFLICQWLCLILLSFAGYGTLSMTNPKMKGVIKLILCFPVGLAGFVLVGSLILITGIPYTAVSTVLGCVLLCAGMYFLLCRRDGISRFLPESGVKGLLIGTGVIIAVSGICASGLLPISVSNDTYYFFSFYPRCIVDAKGLLQTFDVYLTDVGIGSAALGTLPYLFGFNETFGVQYMLNVSTLALFAKGVFDLPKTGSFRKKLLFALLSVGLLIAATPFQIVARWALSNVYFMDYMLIGAYLAQNLLDEEAENSYMPLFLVSLMLSALRMEGTVYVALFVMCISILKYDSKQLAFGMILPALVLHVMYCVRIFLFMDLSSPYQFMTPAKAAILVVIYLAIMVYLLWIRNRLGRLEPFVGPVILLGLAGLNGLLFLRSPSDFATNMVAFMDNITSTGGWGLFPVCVAAIYLLSLGKGFRPTFWDYLSFGYLLYAVAVGFMREGGLRASVGDSGNRVLLQLVPLILFAALTHLSRFLTDEQEGKE